MLRVLLVLVVVFVLLVAHADNIARLVLFIQLLLLLHPTATGLRGCTCLCKLRVGRPRFCKLKLEDLLHAASQISGKLTVQRIRK